MKKIITIFAIFMSFSVISFGEEVVQVLYGGYVSEQKDDILSFKDIYTNKETKEELLRNKKVFFLNKGEILLKTEDTYDTCKKYIWKDREVYSVNLEVLPVEKIK